MYLLDTQQAMDFLSRDHERSVFRWISETKPGRNDLFVSVLSIGQIAHAIELMLPVDRNHWRRLLQEGRRNLDAIGSILDVDMTIVEVWQASLRGENLIDIPEAENELGEDDRLILATAIARNYSLVTEGSRVIEEISARTTLTVVEV
jgi:predicted nucleic acid-binding protein